MKKVFLFLILSIALLNLAFAGHSIGNASDSIESNYAPGDFLKGWINMSVVDESYNSDLKIFNHSIRLVELLNLSGSNYECSTVDCEPDYISSGESISKSSNVGVENKVYGIKLEGMISSVETLSFSIQSNSGPSCNNQIKIDILDDETFDFGNNKSTTEACYLLKKYGCFNASKTSNNFVLDNAPYCQRINLSESPGFKLGAWIKKSGNGNGVTFNLFEKSGAATGQSCDVQDSSISSQGGEVSCQIGFLVTQEKEYYVCAMDMGDTRKYEIKGYSSGDGCGFRDYPPRTGSAAYQIFAQGVSFGSFGTIQLNKQGGDIINYLQKRYDRNCTNGCTIPIKIISSTSQNIILKDLNLEYIISGGGRIRQNLFSDVSEVLPKISFDFQKISFDNANISVPSEFGNHTLQIKFLENEILRKNITIEKVPQISGLSPTQTVAGYPTEFFIIANSSLNISNFFWEFGDNTNLTTTKNSAIHSYNKTGNFTVKVAVNDKAGKTSSKTFGVVVGSPKEVVNSTLSERLKELENLKSNISKYDSTLKSKLEGELGVSEKENKIEDLKRKFLSSSRDDEYIEIMGELLEIDIPKKTLETKKAEKIIFYPDDEDINLEIIRSIAGGDSGTNYGKKDVVGWNAENIEIVLDYEEISAEYKAGNREVLSVFDIKVSKKGNFDYTSYMFIKKSGNMSFDSLWDQKDGYYYKEVDGEENVRLITTEDLDFSTLPIFISPSLSRVGVSKASPIPFTPNFNWTLFLLIIFGLLVLGLIVYIFLQEWYKRKYEKYLFKDRNYLFNIATYISESKNKGLSEQEIRKNLKKVGWSGEQVDYAVKKYFGRRTGMIELPFLNFFNGEGKKQNRQGNRPFGNERPIFRR